MCLNVFIDIVIEFHHHFLIVMFLPCTPTYTFFFTLYNDSLPNMLYHYVLFFHSHWSIPTFIQSIITFHVYTSPHIPHSTFHILCPSLVARSGAQVIFYENQDGICFLWDLGLRILTVQPSHFYTLAYCRPIHLISIKFQNIENNYGSLPKKLFLPLQLL
jgi:hypothetical protein